MSANKAKCPEGHFYNADRFDECPVCRPELIPNKTEEIITEESKTVFIEHEEAIIPKPEQIEKVKKEFMTVSIFGDDSDNNKAEAEVSESNGVLSVEIDENEDEATVLIQREEIQPQPFAPVEIPQTPEQTPVQPPPPPVSNTDDGRTMGIWNAPSGSEYVVGWLICIKGAHFGESFNIKAGNNTVGRASGMDIYLDKEDSVSRNKHCFITYDPDNQEFFLQQGESSGLTYLNGKIVLSPVKMESKDNMKIGDAEFMLIPLCIGGFKWETFL